MSIPSPHETRPVAGRTAAPRHLDAGPEPVVFGPTDVDPDGLTPPGRSRLEVTTAAVADATVVTVRGELLQETVAVLYDAVAVLTHDPAVHRVIVDLTATAFMDSTGLGALVTLRNHVAVRGGTLVLVRPEDRVFRLFEITRLDTVFDFVDGV